MFLSVLQCAFRRTVAVVLAGTLTATVWAQSAAQPAAPVPDGPQPQRLEIEGLRQAPLAFPQPDRALPVAERGAAGLEQYSAD